jgi:hypothetical protein
MRHAVSCALGCALVLLLGGAARADEPKWATIKGQVVFPSDKKLPERGKVKVTQDKDHCESKGDILDESVVVNPKNKGVKNVVVYLRPDDPNPVAEFPKDKVHPDDVKRKPAEVVIDQPCCMFVPRIVCARVGDGLVVKNSAPVAHNCKWESDNNGSYNQTIPKMESWKLPDPLKKEPRPILYTCTIHGWMSGYVRVFDHPYYAVTDENGNFEIKNAPEGKYRIAFWHENGIRGGAKGRSGETIEIKGPTLEMKPTEFDVSPK